jgi:hypothetical protein
MESLPAADAPFPVELLMPIEALPVAVALFVAAPSKITPSSPAKAGIAVAASRQRSIAAIAVVARRRLKRFEGRGEKPFEAKSFVLDDMT